MNQIAVIGGGAAGMMAAITAAGLGAAVTIYESKDRLGKKILATGNGKCNLGNLQMSVEEYYTEYPALLGKSLERFGTEETVQFFNSLGLLLKEKNGYLYPLCEQASAVLDALRYELQSLRVKIVYEAQVEKVTVDKHGKFQVCYGDKRERFDKVILATGGRAAVKSGNTTKEGKGSDKGGRTDIHMEVGLGYRMAKELGHHVIPQVPALVQLKCTEEYMKSVSGVRCDALIKAYVKEQCIAEERGELQLTDYGVSGIPIFQLSRVVNYALKQKDCKEVLLRIDLLPDLDEESMQQIKLSRRLLQSDRTVEEFFNGIINKKLTALFLRLAGVKPNVDFEEAQQTMPDKIENVYDLFKNWELHVYSHNGFENAQVCAGGVSLEEVTQDMESKLVPGLYLAGELLDVDGRCGGYNLQWAWTSGYLAGQAAGRDTN